MVARPAKMYGLETMVLTRRQVAELKIRGFLMRVWAGLEMSVSEGAVLKKHKVRGKVEMVWTGTEEG